MKFEDKYKELIESINGDDENVLSYDTHDGMWEVQANNGTCVRIGEVEGNIIATADNLDDLLIELQQHITEFNLKNPLK